MALADRFMDLLGQVLGRDEWLIWEMDVSRIVIHPLYNRHGSYLHHIKLRYNPMLYNYH